MEIKFNKTENYLANIRIILERSKDLKITEQDLEALKKALEVVKIDIMMRILEAGVSNDPTLNAKIEQAKNYIESEIERVKSEETITRGQLNYEEYREPTFEEGVSEELANRVREADKNRYEEAKSEYARNVVPDVQARLLKLGRKRDELEELQSKLGDKDQFIMSFVRQHTFGDGKKDYFDLVNECFYAMVRSYDTPEFARTPVKDENGVDEWNRSIFVPIDGPRVRYTIDPKALTQFLNLIRDTELATELGAYDKLLQDKMKAENTYDSYHKKVEIVEKAKQLLDNSDLCAEVEDLLERLSVLKAEERESRKPKQLPIVAPKKPSLWSRFLSLFNKNQNVPEQETPSEVDSNKAAESQVRHAKISELYDEYKQKSEANPDFGKLCNIYLQVGQYCEYHPNYEIRGILPYIGFANPFDLLQDETGEKSMREFVMERFEAYTKAKSDKRYVELAQDTINSYPAARQEAYAKLSPRAKEIVDAAPDGRVNMESIVERYIKQTESRATHITPYTAALILETFLHMNDIKTPIEAEEFGINIDLDKIEAEKNNTIKDAKMVLEKCMTRNDDEPEL